jgi:hypothetical protein
MDETLFGAYNTKQEKRKMKNKYTHNDFNINRIANQKIDDIISEIMDKCKYKGDIIKAVKICNDNKFAFID